MGRVRPSKSGFEPDRVRFLRRRGVAPLPDAAAHDALARAPDAPGTAPTDGGVRPRHSTLPCSSAGASTPRPRCSRPVPPRILPGGAGHRALGEIVMHEPSSTAVAGADAGGFVGAGDGPRRTPPAGFPGGPWRRGALRWRTVIVVSGAEKRGGKDDVAALSTSSCAPVLREQRPLRPPPGPRAAAHPCADCRPSSPSPAPALAFPPGFPSTWPLRRPPGSRRAGHAERRFRDRTSSRGSFSSPRSSHGRRWAALIPLPAGDRQFGPPPCLRRLSESREQLERFQRGLVPRRSEVGAGRRLR